MTTLTLWIVIIIAFGFGLMFLVTFLQLMNINKLVKQIDEVLDCLWVALGYFDKSDMDKSIQSVAKRVKKRQETVSSKK